jgi:hypothetical protein
VGDACQPRIIVEALPTRWIQEVIRTALGRRLGQHRTCHHPSARTRHAVRPGPVPSSRVKRVEPRLQSPPLVLAKEIEANVQRLKHPERSSQTG